MKNPYSVFAILSLVAMLGGCGDNHQSGDQVWISPQGLGAQSGTWQVLAPWGIGTVLETKGKMVQVQVERAENAGIAGLKEGLRPGKLHWFPENELKELENGKEAWEKRLKAHSALTKAFSAFAWQGEPALTVLELKSALETARASEDGQAVLALEILQAGTDKSSSLLDRINAIRELLARNQLAQEAAGRVLAAWVRDKSWDQRMSGLDFSKTRRKLIVQPSLGNSVPGAMAGAVAISIYEQVSAEPTALPTKEDLAGLEAVDRALWEMVLEGAPKGIAADRASRLEKLVAEFRRSRLARLRANYQRKLEAQLQQQIDEAPLSAHESFGAYLKSEYQKAEKEGRHWPLTEHDMMLLLVKAEQAAQQARQKEEARRAQEELERQAAERDRKLIEELEGVALRFVEALKNDDWASVCRIANSIPVGGKESGMERVLRTYWGENGIANAFAPRFVRVHRYEEYEKPLHGSDAVAEVDLEPSPGRTQKRIQFRRIQGEWRIYSGPWWHHQSGKTKLLEKRCRDYRDENRNG